MNKVVISGVLINSNKQLSEKERETHTQICSVADFHGINIPDRADSRLLTPCH